MNTNELIRVLAADTRTPAAALSTVWLVAVAIAVALAAAVFVALLGPRPDIGAASETPRFVFKFVVTLALAGGAFVCARALSRPDGNWRRAMRGLAIAPLLLAMSVLAELYLLPSGTWRSAMIGTNSLVCLTYIPLIGAGPLICFMVALRHGAPSRPALAGAMAGLLAGGIAATFYAAHCTDDSPLFVATWYPIAIAGLAFFGAAGANLLARW
jgi:hypothetical protein